MEFFHEFHAQICPASKVERPAFAYDAETLQRISTANSQPSATATSAPTRDSGTIGPTRLGPIFNLRRQIRAPRTTIFSYSTICASAVCGPVCSQHCIQNYPAAKTAKTAWVFAYLSVRVRRRSPKNSFQPLFGRNLPHFHQTALPRYLNLLHLGCTIHT